MKPILLLITLAFGMGSLLAKDAPKGALELAQNLFTAIKNKDVALYTKIKEPSILASDLEIFRTHPFPYPYEDLAERLARGYQMEYIDAAPLNRFADQASLWRLKFGDGGADRYFIIYSKEQFVTGTYNCPTIDDATIRKYFPGVEANDKK